MELSLREKVVSFISKERFTHWKIFDGEIKFYGADFYGAIPSTEANKKMTWELCCQMLGRSSYWPGAGMDI